MRPVLKVLLAMVLTPFLALVGVLILGSLITPRPYRVPRGEGAAVALHGPITSSTLALGDGVELRVVWIPGGSFVRRAYKSRPVSGQRRISLDPFWMGETEVTVEQFQHFVKATGHQVSRKPSVYGSGTWTDPGHEYLEFEQTPAHPVQYVSWHDAIAFCEWASSSTGISVTLPTEVQWEYAARGQTDTKWYWGDRFRDCASFEVFEPDTARPVAMGNPNPFGLYDMLGNVGEMCIDPVSLTNITGPLRVLKGTGNWQYPSESLPEYTSVTRESSVEPYHGFRVCVPDLNQFPPGSRQLGAETSRSSDTIARGALLPPAI